MIGVVILGRICVSPGSGKQGKREFIFALTSLSLSKNEEAVVELKERGEPCHGYSNFRR